MEMLLMMKSMNKFLNNHKRTNDSDYSDSI